MVFRRLAGHASANTGRRRRHVRAYDDFVPSIRQSLTGRYRLMTDCVRLLDAEDRWRMSRQCQLEKVQYGAAFLGKLECAQSIKKALSPVRNEVTNGPNRSGRSMNKALVTRLKTQTDSRRDGKRQKALSQATICNQQPSQTPLLMRQLKALAD